MHSLPVIKQACASAVEEAEENEPGWRAAYVSIVDPHSVLEMAAIIETLLLHVDQSAPELAAKVREQIG